MKLSSTSENKDRLIEIINGFFDAKFIDEASRLTKFVQRESKLKSILFFSLCVYSKAGRGNKFGGFMQGVAERRD
jgi:hypothetical protein